MTQLLNGASSTCLTAVAQEQRQAEPLSLGLQPLEQALRQEGEQPEREEEDRLLPEQRVSEERLASAALVFQA